jgi:hypothetical protein
MANLAEDWDAFTANEKDMIVAAMAWYSLAQGTKGYHVALIPFLSRHIIRRAVNGYINTIGFSDNRSEQDWDKLNKYLIFGPYVRKWKNG